MPKLGPAGGGAPSGRTGRGRRVSTSLAEINVVPLVDVMLVLLIIFMVTAPLIQRGIEVKLPQARRATQVSGERVELTIPESYRQARFVYLETTGAISVIPYRDGQSGADSGSEPASGGREKRRGRLSGTS